MATTNDLMRILGEFEATPDATGMELRMDLADIVIGELKRRGWTQKDLAATAGMKASFINRVVHSSSNCTFDVAGRILFALGIRGKLTAVAPGSTVEIRAETTATPGVWVADLDARRSYDKADYEESIETEAEFCTANVRIGPRGAPATLIRVTPKAE